MSTPASGLRLAVGTLTRIPVGDVGSPTRAEGRWAMLLAPLAALPLAAGAGLLLAVGRALELPPPVSGLLVVALLAWATRGMHLDGLADTVDGLGGGWDRDRALAIMRSGDVGPMGVAAVVLVLTVQGVTLAASSPWAAAGCVIASRAACTVLALRGVHPARPDGLGALVAGTVPAPAALLVLVLCGLVLTGTLLGAGWAGSSALLAGPAAVLALVVTCAVLLRGALSAVGGVTGDHFGAAVELSLTALLVVLTAGAWA
ncbi:adenosylcobinamide-GDP ribazoletransferase [Kytococcus sp. Marseille-QA3725]